MPKGRDPWAGLWGREAHIWETGLRCWRRGAAALLTELSPASAWPPAAWQALHLRDGPLETPGSGTWGGGGEGTVWLLASPMRPPSTQPPSILHTCSMSTGARRASTNPAACVQRTNPEVSLLVTLSLPFKLQLRHEHLGEGFPVIQPLPYPG